MASIPGKDTKPEIIVRSELFRQGFRFRKNVKSLPGKPDIVLAKYKTVVLIHGCFWHGHNNCKKATKPTSNRTYWNAKIQNNIIHDRIVKNELTRAGWSVITIWDCKLINKKLFAQSMKKLLLNLNQNLLYKNAKKI